MERCAAECLALNWAVGLLCTNCKYTPVAVVHILASQTTSMRLKTAYRSRICCKVFAHVLNEHKADPSEHIDCTAAARARTFVAICQMQQEHD